MDTWLGIERAVCQSRLQQYQLSSFVPSNFTFYKNLLIFLGIPPVGESYTNENTLIYVDVETGSWEHMEIGKTEGKQDVTSIPQLYLFIIFI